MEARSRIPCYRLGENRRGTVLLLGGPGASLWMPLVENLQADYQLIIPDIFSGISKMKSGDTPFDFAEILTAPEVSAESIHLVAWSLSTSVALALFESSPERFADMVWICGYPNRLRPAPASLRREIFFNFASMVPAAAGLAAPHVDRLLRLQKKTAGLRAPARLAKRFGLLDPLTDDADFNAVVQEFLKIDSTAYRNYTGAVARYSKDGPPPIYPAAVLAISGERDIFVPAKQIQQVAAEIPRCEYFEIISGTHYVPVEYGELLALKLDDFFKRTGRK